MVCNTFNIKIRDQWIPKREKKFSLYAWDFEKRIKKVRGCE